VQTPSLSRHTMSLPPASRYPKTSLMRMTTMLTGMSGTEEKRRGGEGGGASVEARATTHPRPPPPSPTTPDLANT